MAGARIGILGISGCGIAENEADPELDIDLQLRCGLHKVAITTGELIEEYSDPMSAGEPCAISDQDSLNTYSFSLLGDASSDYSAVVRCGYIRYDNGTFVGDRIVVEARDGQWCHELALEAIDLQDRMLLTDVSFAIEQMEPSAPEIPLIVRFEGREGPTSWHPAEPNLCVYVAHVQGGAYTCGLVSGDLFCECPEDERWADFFGTATLAFGAL